ncbi:MAG: glycosyltransferase family 39 protein [Phycisphaeraceae bacterium]|nr:glycosyltransferase family 39 protein [Phycisphaeraceae bacterium]
MSTASPASRDRSTSLAILFALLIAGFYVFLTTGAELWDRDEPRFARAAVEMVRTGDYLVPRFNGQLRPDKPAMIYWLMSVPVRVLGATEVAVRLPSALATGIAAFLTFLIGRRLYNPRVGLWAMLILPSSLLMLYMGGAATADAVLLAWITASIGCFVLAVTGEARWWHWVLLTLTMGGAQLTKGPVGLAVPLLTILAALLLGRARDGRGAVVSLGRAGGWWLSLAVLLSVGIFAAWGMPADLATGGQFARLALGKHVLQRMIQPMEGHGGSNVLIYLATLPVYLIVILVGFFPWIGMLLSSPLFKREGQTAGQQRARVILLAWIVPALVLMSLVVTKLPHYILPVFPALAVASAAAIDRLIRDPGARASRLGTYVTFIQADVMILGMVVGPWLLHDKRLALSILPGAIGLLLAMLGAWYWRKRNVTRAGVHLIAAGVLLFACLAVFFFPVLDTRLKVSKTLARVVEVHRLTDLSISAAGYEEPSLAFYLDQPVDRPLTFLPRTGGAIAAWMGAPGPALLITTRALLRSAPPPPADVPIVEIWSRPTIMYAKGVPVEVVLLWRGGSPP